MEKDKKQSSKKRKWIYVSLIFILLELIFLVSFYRITTSRENTFKKKYTFSEKKNTYKNLAEQTLTLTEYKKEITEMTDLINQHDPAVALARLKKQMDTNPKILYACHEILHKVGRIAYAKYTDLSKAMEYRDEVCVGGYIHGAIEGYFGATKPDFSKMTKACSQYKDNTFIRWECFHGMGHGLMLYTDNDVPQALMACNLITNDSDQDGCYSGVYMENFNADTTNHPSRYIKDPFGLCAKDTKHPSACYMNAPFVFLNYYNNDYKGALEWCDEAPISYQDNCYQGVGAQITRRKFHEPKEIEQICTMDSKKTESCIAGMAIWYVDYYNNRNQAEAMCNKLGVQSNKEICLQTIQQTTFIFLE